MGFSKLMDGGIASVGTSPPKQTRRERAVDMFIVHGAATTSLKVLLGIFSANGGRGTSANYAIANDGTIIGAVDESMRAWASGGKRDGAIVDGARFDHRAITVEIVNDRAAPFWTCSPEAFESTARLIEDCSRRYGFPLRRATAADPRGVTGHRDLLATFRASYATACPAGISVDALIARAQQIRSGGGAAEEGDDMFTDQDRSDLRNVYAAIFQGGTSMPEGKPITKLLAELKASTFGQAVVVREVDGKPQRISSNQELADAKTLLIAQQAQIAALTTAVQQLATSQGVDPESIGDSVEEAVRSALSGLSVTATIAEPEPAEVPEPLPNVP